MAYRNDRPKQYALKVRRGAAVYSVGPYNSIEEAKEVMYDIGHGSMDEFKTQRGSIVYLTDIPESIEIVAFETRERRDHGNREDS